MYQEAEVAAGGAAGEGVEADNIPAISANSFSNSCFIFSRTDLFVFIVKPSNSVLSNNSPFSVIVKPGIIYCICSINKPKVSS